MGCGVSRLDGNGLALPDKLRPVFLSRAEEILARRRGGDRPLKISSAPSNKELLLLERDEDDKENGSRGTVSSPKDGFVHHETKLEEIKMGELEKGKVEEPGPKMRCILTKLGNQDVKRGDTTKDGVLRESMGLGLEAQEKGRTAEMRDAEKDDEGDDDGRMIGRKNDDAFPGSPSFRVYFDDKEEEDHNEMGKNDGFKDSTFTEDSSSSKESSVNQKSVKGGGKRRGFRNVLPKNLLNVKSCYTWSNSSHDRTLLLTGRTTAA